MAKKVKDLETTVGELFQAKEDDAISAACRKCEKVDALETTHGDVPEPASEEEQQNALVFYRKMLEMADAEGIVSLPGKPLPPQMSNVDKLLFEAEAGRSPQELETAENWVKRQMGGRLTVQNAPKNRGKEGALEIVFFRFVVDQSYREMGITTLPDGWTVTRSVPVPVLARYYISIILDETSYQTDAEKLRAIWADSRERNSHPTELDYLFVGAEKGNKITVSSVLKPLRRRKRGHKNVDNDVQGGS